MVANLRAGRRVRACVMSSFDRGQIQSVELHIVVALSAEVKRSLSMARVDVLVIRRHGMLSSLSPNCSCAPWRI